MASLIELPKGVYRQRKRLADGSVVIYYRDRGTGKRIDAEPCTADFSRKLSEVRGEHASTPAKSWAALVVEFKRSRPNYLDLSAQTRSRYDRYFEMVRDWEPHPVADLKASDFLKIRDSLALSAPATGGQFIAKMKAVMKFSVQRDYREASPLIYVEPTKGGTYKTWSDAQISHALTAFPERFKRAVLVALYTGQREGDCVAMTWGMYDGTGIQVKQEKTDEELWIPVHRVLREALDRWKCEPAREKILINAWDREWAESSFAVAIHTEIKKHRKLDGMVFHGLRKAAATRLAEAGCSTHEIAAITGHATLGMIELYTKKADQRRRAVEAMRKLELVADNS